MAGSPSDSDRVAGLRAGDTHAYEAVFRDYHARLCSFAYSYLQNRSEAEEVVQDLFLALWQKREQLEVRTSLRAYLFTAVRNRVLNRSARASLEKLHLEQLDPPDLESTPENTAVEDHITTEQIAARVQAAMTELPDGCRRVLQLRWQDGLSYAEIAEALGISIKGVENQLARARKGLRQRLSDLIG